MRSWIVISLCLCWYEVQADTIERYMNIVRNISVMEMKADSESQAWARSARHVLRLTNESIAETLTLTNTLAAERGNPVFCMPAGAQLSAKLLYKLIQQTYLDLSGTEYDKNTLSVSHVALLAVTQKYRCTRPGESAADPAGFMPKRAVIDHVAADSD